MSAEHIPKATLSNQWTIANILLLMTVVAGGVGVWVTLNVQVARADTSIAEVDKRVSRMEQQIDERLRDMGADIRQIHNLMLEDRRKSPR